MGPRVWKHTALMQVSEGLWVKTKMSTHPPHTTPKLIARSSFAIVSPHNWLREDDHTVVCCLRWKRIPVISRLYNLHLWIHGNAGEEVVQTLDCCFSLKTSDFSICIQIWWTLRDREWISPHSLWANYTRPGVEIYLSSPPSWQRFWAFELLKAKEKLKVEIYLCSEFNKPDSCKASRGRKSTSVMHFSTHFKHIKASFVLACGVESCIFSIEHKSSTPGLQSYVQCKFN